MSVAPRPRTLIAIAVAATLVVLPALSYAASVAWTPTTSREIHINASPETVWSVLTDFDSYPEWNPVITTISGTPEVNERLAFTTTSETGSAMSFTPTVLTADPGRELRWLGQLWIGRLVDGEHSFTLHPDGKGTRLVQAESFTGVIAPLTPLPLDLERDFERSNQAICDRAESSGSN